jgi:hypothetical protein
MVEKRPLMKIRAARVKGWLPTMPAPPSEKEREELLALMAERDKLEQRLITLNEQIRRKLNDS